jgi:tetratricopeptide (TPR) repeat protein
MARRVNSKFLAFLVAVSGAVLLSGVGAFYFRAKARNVDYRQLEAQADDAIQQGDLERGASLLMTARDQVPDNTEVLVKLGDALDRLTGKDPIHLGQARIQWNKAVSVDPHCVPALRSLLKSYADELDINPRPEVFVEVKMVCDRLLNVMPSDLPAQEKKQVAVIHEWLANQTASNEEVRESIETYLPDLIRRDPENAELPRTLALARIQQAREMLNGNDLEDARFVLNEATKMLDAARTGREKNADMQYRAFQSYLKIKQMDPDVKTSKVKEKDYNDRINESITAALALAENMDPEKDPLCDDIHQAASEWASQQGKPDEAEKIMGHFFDKHKNDQRARLTMARVLEIKGDPDSRAKAVEILQQDAVEGKNIGGFQALVQRDLAAQTVGELIRIYLAEYSSTLETDTAARKDLSGKIEEKLDDLRHLYPPQSVPVLNLEGRFHLLKGENVEAVKTFEEAVLQMSPSNLDNDLLYQLAIAYIRTGQPGRARQKLEQVILKMDSAVPPRIQLARVLLQFNDLAGAAVQLRKLQELAPDSPDVRQIAASLALANYRENPGPAASVYGQMPETTREERMAKAQVAVALGRGDEGARILEAVLKDASQNARQLAQLPPGATEDQKKKATQNVELDIKASLTLAQVYAGTLGQRETAKRVIDDSLKLHPDDPTLVDAYARLHDMLPEDIYSMVSKAVQKTPDPFKRNMQMFDLESRPGGHPEQAFGHLLEASKLKPDDTTVLDLMFGHYINRGKFDQAAPIVDKLAAQNADQCGGLMYRYRLSLVRGDLAAAEDQGRQLTQLYQEFAAGWLVTAQVLQLRGKFEEAEHFYLEVLNRQPGQYDAYRGLIECYFRLNKPDDAEIRLREARAHYPNDAVLREQLLVYLVNYGKAAEAVPEREKILADDRQRQTDVADDYLQLAKAYFHAAQDEAYTKPGDSVDNLNKAFATLAQGREKFPDEGRFASQLAEMFQYNRDLDSGEKVLKELHDRPDQLDNPEPAELLSDFELRADRMSLAEFYLNEAMVKSEKKLGGPDIAIRLRMASLQAQERQFDRAYRTLDGAGKEAKTDPSVVRQRLEIMIAEGRRDDARKGLEAELTKRDGPDLHNLLASLLIDNRELDEALKEVDHVLTLDPRNDAALYLQSLAIARKGDIPRATSQLVALRNRDPRNAQVRLLLGELYGKSGKTDYAIRELEDALQKLPTNRDLRLALIQLYRGEQPLTNDAMDSIIRTCSVAEADPVLRSDPTWAREEALAYAAMDPPQVPNAVGKWQQVIKLAPDKPDYRREFVDLLIQFHDWNAVINETGKLARDGHDEWWLHYQRGMASAHLGDKDKALAEFEKALKVTDLATAGAQGEFIIRGIGENCGHDLALNDLAPLLGNDPEGRWHLLQATELRVMGRFAQAEFIVQTLLADAANKPAERRAPLLRAKADICRSFADAQVKDPAKALAENLGARDAYVELLGLLPDDTIALNNLACLLAERIPAPQGGPLKAKVYSTKAYDNERFKPTPNVKILDTQGWVLTLCGGDDAIEGMTILHRMIAERDDTRTFVEGRYHLGEAYLRAPKPDLTSAQKWLKEAIDLIAEDEKAGKAVDGPLKDKIQTSLAKATGPVTSSR